MTIATKTLATILLNTMLSVGASGATALRSVGQSARTANLRRLERLYRRHDRKLELRASVLGMTADELRLRLKECSFEKVVRQAGFKDISAFYIALIGKSKDELRKRGWNERRLRDYIAKQLSRYDGASPHFVFAPQTV